VGENWVTGDPIQWSNGQMLAEGWGHFGTAELVWGQGTLMADNGYRSQNGGVNVQCIILLRPPS